MCLKVDSDISMSVTTYEKHPLTSNTSLVSLQLVLAGNKQEFYWHATCTQLVRTFSFPKVDSPSTGPPPSKTILASELKFMWCFGVTAQLDLLPRLSHCWQLATDRFQLLPWRTCQSVAERIERPL